MALLSIDQLHYLALEGGGGKGIAYLGAIRALEDLLREKNGWTESKPLFDLSVPVSERQLRGISGSSAGAITAFMLALGMSYEEINEELEKTLENAVVSGRKTPISQMENFFDDPFRDGAQKFELRSIESDRATSFEFNKGGIRTALDAISRYTKINHLVAIIVGQLTLLFIDDDNALKKILTRKLLFNQKLGTNDSQSENEYFKGFRRSRLQVKTTYNPENIESLLDYVTGLAVSFGLFSGFNIQSYFAELMKVRLALSEGIDPLTVTFSQFFSTTGVDLIVTGVNISRQTPMYFSVYHTPQFPVVAAIEISMNVPFLFKPIYVKTTVNAGASEEYNRRYHGLWVDGGVINNYPLHAFDILETHMPEDSTISEGLSVTISDAMVGGGFPKSKDAARSNVLGIRLTEGLSTSDNRDDVTPADYDMMRYIKEVALSFMYSSEAAQIRSDSDRERTIELFTEEIGMTDFSNMKLDEQRKAMVTCSPGTAAEDQEPMKEMKLRVINRAEEVVKNYFRQ